MATTENGKITFSFTTSQLFNDVCLISSFMTKNLMNENGSALDDFAITDDERELFDVCVKQTTPNIFESMLKMTKCTEGYVNDGTNISFSVKDNYAHNENAITLVESTIYDCLKFGVLSEYYSMCINAPLQSIVNKKYSDALLLLNQRLFQLKKKSISSLY